MCAMGLVCAALSRYLDRQSMGNALLLGAAAGFGVWARSNFLWLIVAGGLAALITFRRQAIPPLAHIGGMLVGAVAGAAPWLVYQIISRGGTFEAITMFAVQDTWQQMLTSRSVMFAETLLSDREHRVMWSAPPVPEWQPWLFAAIVLTASVLCLRRTGWPRAIALTFLLLAAPFLGARLPVAEHHLIALVPLAICIVVLALAHFRRLGIAVAAIYFSCALYTQFRTVEGLAETGGTGPWSDAIFPLTDYLEQLYSADQEIKVIDWGLQNSIYVLSDGRVRTREVLDANHDWAFDIAHGGVFLMNGPENRQIPAPTEAFLKALEAVHPKAKRMAVRQRNGARFAEIVDIPPAK
jgi:hypothetical protein